ncbi:helix-turn-helix domain-containing protein [Rhodococcus sp. 3Y1]
MTLSEAARALLIHLAHTGMPAEQRLRAQQVCVDLLTPASAPHFDVPIPEIRGYGCSSTKCCRIRRRSITRSVGSRSQSQPTYGHPDFAAELALSFAQWRTLVRMSTALGMLGTGMSVNAVSRRVGYGTSSSFIAAFARRSATPPAMRSPLSTDSSLTCCRHRLAPSLHARALHSLR